ncbi:MAG: tryptophan 2,3-dioxygenase family protein, partial [Longimicrobiales bacterium]
SGFQSAQFRCIEFVCGLKNERHLQNYGPGTEERAELERRLAGTTVGESFYDLLRRRGFDLPAGSGPDDDRASEQRVRALTGLYHNPDRHYDLYLLAEALVEFDQMFSLWRLHHIEMVERMIGSKRGTGGSEGVAYLRNTLNHKFFPELWALRNLLSPRSSR